MEKKVPERKVSLQDNDLFYVYDKRINKCVKEDCNGTVKYGLVLRVSVVGEETCNCFECNKCHMKYTPYPNYVRLSKTDMLNIYNQDEVTKRDEKRAEDARKQQLREKRKNAPRKAYDRPYNKDRHFTKKDGSYRDGYNKEGQTQDGYRSEGFKKEGFRKEGFKREGFKKYGNVVITKGNTSRAYDRNRNSSYKPRFNNDNNSNHQA